MAEPFHGMTLKEAREAIGFVRPALELRYGSDEQIAAQRKAFDFLRTSENKRLLSLAHLLQPGATPASIQAAIVPLERVEVRGKVTDVEMGIRNSDSYGAVDKARFAVVADNIRSAFNMGGIFRTADFFGAEKIVLCGYSPTPNDAPVKKTALGADESVKWEKANDVREVIPRLKAEGRRIYALETAEGATDIAKFEPVLPCALILGNERFGIDPDVVAMADEVVAIPSHGMKNSLNVVSAFAIAAAFLRAKIK